MKRASLAGYVSGFLTVLRYDENSKRGEQKYVCQCKCGKIISVRGTLLKGKQQSCGCKPKRKMHGMTGTRTHRSWLSMHARCKETTASHNSRYFARGITVCERWGVFANFLADMGERPPGTSLDRINNNGIYEPGNCRWATRQEQTSNMASNRFYTLNGETKTQSEWARTVGIANSTIKHRIEVLGMTVEQALTPSKLRKKS